MPALLRPSAISASTSLSRGVRKSSGDCGRARAATSASTTRGSITEPPLATASMRAPQHVDVGHALLQEVGASVGAVLEQRERVVGLDVLAEHHDADVRVRRPDEVRGAHALVGPGRRHPDVGDHDIGRIGLDAGDQRVEILVRGDDLEAGFDAEEADDAFPHEVVVLGHDDSDRHAGSLRAREDMPAAIDRTTRGRHDH